MDLSRYVDELRSHLAVAAEAGGEDARMLAERLTAPLESATRLVLLDALTAAADEITRDLAPGSVDVRLRGREPEFVVTPSPVEAFADDRGSSTPDPMPDPGRAPAIDGEEGATSRITLRLADHLKTQIEDAAGRDGISVNAWLVRTVAGAVGAPDGDRRPVRHRGSGGQRFTGWAR